MAGRAARARPVGRARAARPPRRPPNARAPPKSAGRKRGSAVAAGRRCHRLTDRESLPEGRAAELTGLLLGRLEAPPRWGVCSPSAARGWQLRNVGLDGEGEAWSAD